MPPLDTWFPVVKQMVPLRKDSVCNLSESAGVSIDTEMNCRELGPKKDKIVIYLVSQMVHK